MKIKINNFGPIDTITFDMDKDFHLIYGKNSIGKSYATYCLYCLIKNLKGKQIFRSYYYGSNNNDPYRDKLKTLFKKYKTDKSIASEFIAFAHEFLSDALQEHIIPGLNTSLRNTFSNLTQLKNAYTKQSYSIDIIISDEVNFSILSDEFGEPYLGNMSFYNNWEFIEKTTKSTKYSVYIDSKKWVGSPNEDKFINDYLYSLYHFIGVIFDQLDGNIREVYYLPASRSGLYQALNSFTPIIAELTQSRFFLQTKKLELPSLSEPLADYFLDITTIDSTTNNTQYNALIEDFEKNILDGIVSYDNETKKIKYKPFDLDFELDIAEVSSMVAELSPIVIFLKHILHHKFSTNYTEKRNLNSFFMPYRKKRSAVKEIIFIEEPEAHLHPEVQVKLAEIFAELTNHNINIVMTSHSNYMFNKINNIILKQNLKSESLAVYQLVKGISGSKCNPEMTVDEEGISDENFVEVAKKLYEERLNSLGD